MGDNARYVFRASRDAHKSITRLFDFIHPTAISLWNLRWQVQGYMSSVPTADAKVLEARFAIGSGIGAGSLKRATVETTWDEQLGNFASFILMNTIAIFEDYVSAICEVSSLSNSQKTAVEKQLQFPSTSNNGGISGARSTLGVSNLVAGAVTWDQRTVRRIDEANIESLLICYRYFKELRNSISHNGGRAGQRQLDAQSDYLRAISNGKIGSVQAPDYLQAQSLGDEIKPTYRGVIGFSEVILHIIATYDHILSQTPVVENELRAVLTPDKMTWPASEVGKIRRFNKLFDRNSFPKFAPTPDLVAFLKSEGFVPQAISF